MKAALPNVLDSIREKLVGLIDEAVRSRSSSSRPTAMDAETAETEREEDTTHLMQRTATGMLRTSKQGQGIREDKLALHQELQDFPPGTASHLARRLRRRLEMEMQKVDDWAAVDAVLAANLQAAQTEWVDKWAQRLIWRPIGTDILLDRPGPSQPTI